MDHLVGEAVHSALCVLDNGHFSSAKKLLGDYNASKRIGCRATSLDNQGTVLAQGACPWPGHSSLGACANRGEAGLTLRMT